MIDTARIHREVNLLTLVVQDTELKRVASTHGGEWAGPCPFCGGRDRFRVWPFKDKPDWWCRQCGKGGDVIDYVGLRDGLDFLEACQVLGAPTSPSVAQSAPKPTTSQPARAEDREDWQTRAVMIMVDRAALLWEPEGEGAKTYLHKRGLNDDTLWRWWIGYNPVEGNLYGFHVWHGITIPHWQESVNTISGIKVRLSTDRHPKYKSILGSRASLYLADTLPGHDVAILCEGELDALLLEQEAGDLVGVCALGSAANKQAAVSAGLSFLPSVKRLLVATDNDREGEEAAAYLVSKYKRFRRLPIPHGKDVTDFYLAGGDLRAWVGEALAELGPKVVTFAQADQREPGTGAVRPLTMPTLKRVSLADLGEYTAEHPGAKVVA